MRIDDFPLTESEEQVVTAWLLKGPWQVSKDSGMFSKSVTLFQLDPYELIQLKEVTFSEAQIIAARRNQLLARSEA